MIMIRGTKILLKEESSFSFESLLLLLEVFKVFEAESPSVVSIEAFEESLKTI